MRRHTARRPAAASTPAAGASTPPHAPAPCARNTPTRMQASETEAEQSQNQYRTRASRIRRMCPLAAPERHPDTTINTRHPTDVFFGARHRTDTHVGTPAAHCHAPCACAVATAAAAARQRVRRHFRLNWSKLLHIRHTARRLAAACTSAAGASTLPHEPAPCACSQSVSQYIKRPRHSCTPNKLVSLYYRYAWQFKL